MASGARCSDRKHRPPDLPTQTREASSGAGRSWWLRSRLRHNQTPWLLSSFLLLWGRTSISLNIPIQEKELETRILCKISLTRIRLEAASKRFSTPRLAKQNTSNHSRPESAVCSLCLKAVSHFPKSKFRVRDRNDSLI